MSRRGTRVVQAPMAVASDGSIIVNAAHLVIEGDLDAVLRVARESGLPVFVGVVVPPRLRGRFVHEVDDAVADVVGRLGPGLASRTRR